MKIRKLSYSQYEGNPKEWKFNECTFSNINLIVGKNAVGKTRLINVINGLSLLLSETRELNYSSGDYNIEFIDENEVIKYKLHYIDFRVIEEILRINEINYLDRDTSGRGTIKAEELGRLIKFEIPTNEIAAFAKRDTIQHKSLDKLFNWGKSTRCYRFGTSLGQGVTIILSQVDKRITQDNNIKDTENVLDIFKLGVNRYGEKYIELILFDMHHIGYNIERIDIESLEGRYLTGAQRFVIKETDIRTDIYQNEISQGMFRALSLIIQYNYSLLSNEPICVLIDDIGEGLDYERASTLIQLLISKTEKSKIQLIMTTNDRFVMNKVPLKHWIILHREGSVVNNYTYSNSKQVFEDFELTGLNNFDFFSTRQYTNK